MIFSNAWIVFLAVFSQVKVFEWARPFFESCEAVSGLWMRFRMCFLSCSLSVGSNRRVLSWRISFKLPPVDEITGTP